VRRVDGDANGLFADAQDRVWVDYNGTGTWDAATKEFLFAPILRLNEKRFAVRADAWGERLSLTPLEGTGTLKLTLPPAIKADQVEEIQVTLQSRDGVVASLRGLGAEVTVPAGEYRVSTLLLTLKDAAAGPPWGYIFGDNGGKSYQWRTLVQNGSLVVEPVGSLDFSVSIGDGKTEFRPGDSVTVRPALYTGDGLLIERAYRGIVVNIFDSGCSGQIALVGSDGSVLDSSHSGFA
jgi:hypothetical protein